MRAYLVAAAALLALACGATAPAGTDPSVRLAPTIMPCCMPRPRPPAPGLGDLAGPISEVIFQHTDVFGGKPWYDPDGRFVLHVAFVGDEATARDLLAPVIPVDLPVEWHQVKYSEDQMERAVREIGAQQAQLAAINSFSIDSRMNLVVVSFADTDRPELRQLLFERYGDMVVFTVEPRSQPL